MSVLSLSLTHFCLPKSLKKKLTMLQETLNLPPVTSETVNRLVLERFVDPLGVVQVCMLGELLKKGLTSSFDGISGPRFLDS